jgi:formamidopyrimidine-DNA glycosylase
MPELPEVETARRGIEPHLVGKRIVQIVVREPRLRWPVTTSLVQGMQGQTIRAVERRAKYILLRTDAGTAILHLGMSGSLRVLPSKTAPQKWDHVDILLADGQCLRLRDPRRFGALLWTTDDPARHKLLRDLGPEPFDRRFDGNYLFGVTRRRTVAVRDFLLNGRIVAGVGNIYANEALFLSGIRPTRRTGRLTRAECAQLATQIRKTLTRAIRAGGTTLRDFQNADGLPGYFQQTLRVYGRSGAPCPSCGSRIRAVKQGQRSAFFCPKCQT